MEQCLLEIEKKIVELSKTRTMGQEYFDLLSKRRILQRNFSLEKGEETAVLIEWKYPWDTGAPIPHVISNGHRVFLVYYVIDIDPNLDETYMNVHDPSSDKEKLIALVEFNSVVNHKFGCPNDEVLHGHPLYEHGLEAYTAHEIINSKWIAEQEQINAVHSYYDPRRWKALKHFMLTFHDEVFECIAEGYKAEVIKGRFKDVLLETTKRLFDR